MIRVADITQYITAYAKDIIYKYIQEHGETELDLAGCYVFNGGETVISFLEDKGYLIIDSENKMRNAILDSNRTMPTGYKTIPLDVGAADANELKSIIKMFNVNDIYCCTSTATFPIVLFCQIYRPKVRWTISNGISVDYAAYCHNMLYKRNTVLNLAQFMQLLGCETQFDLFYLNNFYVIDKPNKFAPDDIYKLPSRTESKTWSEIAYTEMILPHSLGIVPHRPINDNDVWKVVVDNIVMSLEKPKNTCRDLKAFLRGE